MRDHAIQEGLAWEDNGLGPEARWTRDPDIRAITRVCRRHLGIPADAAESDFVVSFYSDGAYNKLYNVRTPNGQFVMRVALPVDPQNKTRGEAATLQLLARKIPDVPVPQLVAFDDTRRNEIGYEWLLMSRLPGTPAYYRWRKMTMEQKEALTARIAAFHAQLLRCGSVGEGFRGIGTLGARCDDSDIDTAITPDSVAEPGQVVTPFFFAGPRFHYPIRRGPFRSSHDWLRTQLNVIIKEQTAALSQAQNDDDKEYAETALRVARKLLRILHKIFPAIVNPPERTVLWHDDLTLRNILVDNQGNLTGIVGWFVSDTHLLSYLISADKPRECVSTVPRWVASQVPEFLRGAERETKPDRNCYTDVSDKGSEAGDEDGGDDTEDLDNEGKTELYWIHLMEYEQTQLRKVYCEHMRRLRPDWDLEVEEGALKVDFLNAITKCGSGFYLRRIEQWVDALERREFFPLLEVLRVGIKKDKKDKNNATKSERGMT
ncbi:uncharacterized protein CTHT_0039690 [Thermochaetoides thermophila DSM 1495]|uniref:Aminoglycoside phosphotransferase domain-containing protein n=1 Tax=Chaetomium thermophilum (strain DSM 1495 / CBS 144.50 / IMI 039719) TaxID=759272 RepID=G0S4C5_CHATD|nr:hypothetical protein CTHT_0039690 [Thermochaetoides thermophila DSM 1495]EGS22083.1 hypothetical protein CTHT_0039690 [Thermochaetoides thermophila DSM 1495]